MAPNVSPLGRLTAVCITLDPESPTRAKPTLREIKRVGFVNVKTISGVDLRKKSLKDVNDLLSVRAYGELHSGRYVHEALSGLGSVGCYLAHLNAWKKCVKLGTPLVIFEDDLLFTPDAKERIEEAYNSAVENSYDILRICYSIPDYVSKFQAGTPISSSLSRVNRGESAAAYIITPKAAKLAVEHALPMEMHCDHYLDFLSKKYGLNNYYITKSVRIDNEAAKASTLNHNSIDRYPNSCRKEGWIIWGMLVLAVIIGYALWKKRSRS